MCSRPACAALCEAPPQLGATLPCGRPPKPMSVLLEASQKTVAAGGQTSPNYLRKVMGDLHSAERVPLWKEEMVERVKRTATSRRLTLNPHPNPNCLSHRPHFHPPPAPSPSSVCTACRHHWPTRSRPIPSQPTRSYSRQREHLSQSAPTSARTRVLWNRTSPAESGSTIAESELGGAKKRLVRDAERKVTPIPSIPS